MLKAKIISTRRGRQGGIFAQVSTDAKQIVDNVLLIFQHNTATKPLIKERNDSNLVLLIQGYQNDLIYGLPYNPLLEDNLKNGEYKAGNLDKGSFILFDQNGNVILQSPNGNFIKINEGGDIDIIGQQNIKINGQEVNLGGASAAVLNTLATMEVVINAGSSAGTYPVTIVSSGQTSDIVKA